MHLLSEWSSDSGCSNYLDLDLDSPRKAGLKNPFNQDQIFDNLALSAPSRASNPIINDTQFQCIERPLFSHLRQINVTSRAENKNIEV